MDRRSFIATIGGLVTTSRDAFAQKRGPALVGFLCGESPQRWVRLVDAFRRGLGETGYTEDKNLSIDYRWAEGQDERLPALARDLVRRPVDVLVSTGGPNPALAAKAATSTIPIVFTLGADPVRLGLVSSLGRPGGNITGVGFSTAAVNEKRVQLLFEMVPKATVIGVLVASDNPVAEATIKQVEAATRVLGPRTYVLRARTERELDVAFTDFARARISALFVGSDGFFYDRRAQITALAARFGIAACYELREYVEAGGLMSYGADLSEVYRLAGVYTGRILGGVKPAELPVLQPTKLELALNLPTARALGLNLPQPLQLRADVLIQ